MEAKWRIPDAYRNGLQEGVISPVYRSSFPLSGKPVRPIRGRPNPREGADLSGKEEPEAGVSVKALFKDLFLVCFVDAYSVRDRRPYHMPAMTIKR
jgi:hypothetical protein